MGWHQKDRPPITPNSVLWTRDVIYDYDGDAGCPAIAADGQTLFFNADPNVPLPTYYDSLITRGPDVDVENYNFLYLKNSKGANFGIMRDYYGTFYYTYSGNTPGYPYFPTTSSGLQVYAGTTDDAYMSQDVVTGYNTQRHVSDINNSPNELVSGDDPQKDWLSLQNTLDGWSLDLSDLSNVMSQGNPADMVSDIQSTIDDDFVTTRVPGDYFDTVTSGDIFSFQDSDGQTRKIQTLYDAAKDDYSIITDSTSDFASLSDTSKVDIFSHVLSNISGGDYGGINLALTVASQISSADPNSIADVLSTTYENVPRDSALAGIQTFCERWNLGKISTYMQSASTFEETANYQIALDSATIEAEVSSVTTEINWATKISKYAPLKSLGYAALGLSALLTIADTESRIAASNLTDSQTQTVRFTEWGSFLAGTVVTTAAIIGAGFLATALVLPAAAALALSVTAAVGTTFIYTAASNVIKQYYIYKSKGINLVR